MHSNFFDQLLLGKNEDFFNKSYHRVYALSLVVHMSGQFDLIGDSCGETPFPFFCDRRKDLRRRGPCLLEFRASCTLSRPYIPYIMYTAAIVSDNVCIVLKQVAIKAVRINLLMFFRYDTVLLHSDFIHMSFWSESDTCLL